MAFSYVALVGRITIATNSLIDWYEDDGDGHTDDTRNCTIAAGSYYPAALAALIKTAMETASDAGAIGIAHGGVGLNYTITFDPDTGIPTITVSGGTTPLWRPKITVAQITKLLTGGDGAAGSHGRNHLGFNVDSAVPAPALSHSGDIAPANGFYPDQPVQSGMKPVPESLSVESVSAGGNVQCYDFSGDSLYLSQWSLRWTMLTEASRAQFVDEFWIPYAKQGSPNGRFYYYEDRTITATYIESVLTSELVKRPSVERTTTGYPRWTISGLQMRRYKA